MQHRRLLFVLFFAASIVSCACRKADEGGPVMVAAASSLREVLPSAARAHEAASPDARVQFEFAGSQALRAQIEHGAPVDMFISADARHTRALHLAGLLEAPVQIACNTLVIAVPAHNPAAVHGIGDLVRAARIALAAPEVPLGALSEQVLASAGAYLDDAGRSEIRRHIVTRDLSARQTLGRVATGEADAAIVFRTDVLAAPSQVKAVPLPPELTLQVPYWAALASRSRQRGAAAAFLEFITSEAGQRHIEGAGLLRCAAAPGARE